MKNILYFYIGSIFYIRWFGENFFSKENLIVLPVSWSYFDFTITSDTDAILGRASPIS